MAELPTGTVTFLFTDIEGSTRLERRLREGYGEVLAVHQRVVRGAFAAQSGHEVDTQGDSFFYVFARAKSAVEAAVAAQRALAAYPWPEGGEIRVRIGLSTGEAAVEDRRYVGFAVHRAARISAAAHGGQILLSSTTRELVADDLPSDQNLRDLGQRRLKDLPRPERLYQLVAEGLPSEFAAPRTLDEQELAEAAQQALTRRRYRRRAAVALPLAVLAGAAILAAALLLTRGSDRITVQPNSVAVIDPVENRVVGEVPVGVRPSAIAFGAGAVWVGNVDDATVTRIDPRTLTFTRTIQLPATPTGIAVGFGSVWVAHGIVGSISRIDPDPSVNRVIDTIDDVARRATGASIAAGEGAVWFASAAGVVVKIDPATDRPAQPTTAGSLPSAVATGLDAVWVANAGDNRVLKINPRTAGVVLPISVGPSPRGIAVGEGAVWVTSEAVDAVTRIEPVSAAVTTIPIGKPQAGIAAGQGAVWVANADEGTVLRIDPHTSKVAETIDVGNRPVGIAVGAGRLWVSVQQPAT